MGEWIITPLGGGEGKPASAELPRFAGVGQDGGHVAPWSVVMKVSQLPANVGWVNMGDEEEGTH